MFHSVAFVQQFSQWKSNKFYLIWVCICSLWYLAHRTHASYCHLWPVMLYSIFPHYLINDTLKKKGYFLTPWSRVLEKLTSLCSQSRNSPHFYGTRMFFTVLTGASHLSLSWANSIQSKQPTLTSERYILMLSSHLHLGLPNGSFPQAFPPTPCAHLTPPHTRHMPRQSHSSRFYHPHNIG
jgi:hypothetical protein